MLRVGATVHSNAHLSRDDQDTRTSGYMESILSLQLGCNPSAHSTSRAVGYSCLVI